MRRSTVLAEYFPGDTFRDMDTVPKRFAYVIEKSGLKPGPYAKRLGKHAPQISDWLSGKKAISLDSAKEILALSGAPTGWLLNGEGPVPDLQPLPPEADSRFESEVLTSLLLFLPQSGATPDEIAALHEVAKRAVALTGVPDWPKELHKLRVRPDKRLPDGQKIETEVPEGLAKRKRRG